MVMRVSDKQEMRDFMHNCPLARSIVTTACSRAQSGQGRKREVSRADMHQIWLISIYPCIFARISSVFCSILTYNRDGPAA